MMMHWVLFSVVAAGLFWGLYRLLLRRDGWLQLSRFYLIISLVFSLVYPLVPLPELSLPLPERMGLSAAGVGAGGVLSAVEVTDASRPAADAARRIPTMIYLTGVALSLAVLAVQLARTLRMVRRGKPVDVDGRRGTPRLYKAEGAASSFSFFNHIVVESGDMSDDERQCILVHEREHVRLHHTEDVLLMRLLCCAAWFNPFAWLMLGELRAVHERQADAAVLSRCAKEDYLRLLYRQATGFGYGHITHNFNSINLKNRIVMMNKTKSRFGAWKAVVALPVAAVLLLVGCKPAANTEADTQAVIPQQEEPVYDMGPTQLADGEVANVADESPEFPGGMEGLYKYLAENIHYPEQAKTDQIQGRVFITFVVEKDGSISDAKVIRGIGGGCDEEALRVVNAMPKWTPGKQLGEPVRVQFHLPIVFKLS